MCAVGAENENSGKRDTEEGSEKQQKQGRGVSCNTREERESQGKNVQHDEMLQRKRDCVRTKQF